MSIVSQVTPIFACKTHLHGLSHPEEGNSRSAG